MPLITCNHKEEQVRIIKKITTIRGKNKIKPTTITIIIIYYVVVVVVGITGKIKVDARSKSSESLMFNGVQQRMLR